MIPKEFLRRNKYLILIVATGILLRAIFFAATFYNFGDKGFYPHNSEDSEQYFQLARNLVLHNVFSLDSAPPFGNEIFRVPGYPFFISLFYRIIPAAWPAIIFQNLLAIAIVILIYAMAVLLFQNKSVALIAAGIYAFEPGVIYWNNQLLSETLFTFLIFLAAYLFLRNIMSRQKFILPTALSVGALVSFANYTRPTAQFTLLIFLIFVFLNLGAGRRNIVKSLCSALLILMSFAVLSAPWVIRNKIIANTYDFSSSSSDLGFRQYLWMMYENRGEDPTKLDLTGSELKLETVKYIARHPFSFLEVHLANLAPFFMGDSYFTAAATIYPPLERQRVTMETWFHSWNQIYDGFKNHKGAEAVLFFGGKAVLLLLNIFILAGIIYWFFLFKKKRIELIFLISLIYYFVLATGPRAYSRFRQAANPYIFILVALGIYWLREYLKSRKTKLIGTKNSV